MSTNSPEKELVVAFSGYPGVGKTELAEHLERSYGFVLREGSTAIREAAELDGITLRERQAYIDYNLSKQKTNPSWLIEKLLDVEAPRVVIPALREVPHKNYLERYENFLHVALFCPPEICLARIPTDDPKNPSNLTEYAEHVAMDNTLAPTGPQTDIMLATAHYSIDTSKPQTESTKELDFLTTLKLGGCAIL